MEDREIQFMAWDGYTKKWLPDFRLHPQGKVMAVEGSSEGKWQYSTEVKEGVTLCQFTGLLDKYGKKIFEGSIIKWKFGAMVEGQEKLEEGISRVVWSPARASFDEYEEGNSYGYALYILKETEVIGHVLENPELFNLG